MNFNFLFMDESFCRNTMISSLTGLLIPAKHYAQLRNSFYDILHWSICPGENIVNLQIPELHGKEFLPSKDDDFKVETLEKVVDLIVGNDLKVYRVGYYITPHIQRMFKGDENLIGLCWLNLLSMLKPITEHEMIVPVMDGFQLTTVKKFSYGVKQLDILRAAGLGESLSIRHSENILGEVFYADSRFSIFTQTVDIVSYLRHIEDWFREGMPMSEYKEKQHQISQKLSPYLAFEKIIALNGERPSRVS